MNRLIAHLLVLMLGLSAPAAADWITEAYFSEKAGIDSIERFLVIPDVDTNRIFGDPILNLGDINDDGCSDIIIARNEGGLLQTHMAFLYFGGKPPDTIFDREFSNFLPVMNTIGDVNNDSYFDIAFTRPPEMTFELFYGGPDVDDITDFIIPGHFSWITTAVDLDDDNILDMPLSTDVNDGDVYIYSISDNLDTLAEYSIIDSSYGFGNELSTGDFNGDGYSDLAIAAWRNRDSSFVKFYWGGPDFDTIPDHVIWSIIEDFGKIFFSLGDFNADGSDDLFISGATNEPHGVYYCGSVIDNEIDIVVNKGDYWVPASAAVAGDINNDGYPDLIVGQVNPYAFVNEIWIFLGGPDTDDNVDVYIENLMIPGGQRDFGDVVAGVGDFNGDGVDDIAVRSVTSGGCCWRGEVNFFAGWNSNGTTVDQEPDFSILDKIELSQNYPNPFNPQTIIEYSIPKSGYVKIIIYNILGREVVTLIDEWKQAGVHQAFWNGRDNSGNMMPSGIYFYRLETDGVSEAKKMILLK